MQNNIRKQFAQIASVLLLALGTVTAAHAVGQPIQTQRGVVRLGSKTQANVDAKQSSVAISEGMVLVSSNPGRLGRPALKVSFNGAPMHAKVQGTVLIAYLRGEFIQITGVEGRTLLVREGRLGEVVAIDAGKMLLVHPTAKRLPDTVDVNLSDFVKNSPMFNGGLELPASQLIARAIEKQSKNRYLKSTPIYFEGAGAEAVIAGESPGLPSAQEGLGDEAASLGSAQTGIDAIERIPRQIAGPQPVPEQLVALQTNGSPGGGGGFNGSPGGGGVGFNGGGGGGFNGSPGGGGVIGGVNDSPGAPDWGGIFQDATVDIYPSRGFQKNFTSDGGGYFWFPITTPDDVILRGPPAALGIFPSPQSQQVNHLQTPTPPNVRLSGLVQGAAETGNSGDIGSAASYIIFPEARIPDASVKTAFKITPTSAGSSNMILKFSNQDIPSDILTASQFKDAFSRPAGAHDASRPDLPSPVDTQANFVVVSDKGTGTRDTKLIDDFAPLNKVQNPPRLEMTLVVPPEGITINVPFFKTDTITQPNGPIVGLDAPRFMGSVFVDVTSGDGVMVEVGDRQGSRALQFQSTDETSGLVFSLQAPPSTSVAGGMLTIESTGSLNISDPSPIISVQSTSGELIAASSSGDLVISKVGLSAGQGIGVSSSRNLVFSEATLNAGQSIAVSSSSDFVFSKVTLTAGQGIAVSSSGELVFNEATLNAGQGIAVSSSGNLEFSGATLNAGQGIGVSSSGGLVFDRATLAAGQGIAVSGSGGLVFNQATLAAGQGIAISGPSDLVFSKATLAAGQGIAVSSSSNIEFSEATLSAGQGIAISSPSDLVFSKAILAAGQGIAVSSSSNIEFSEATLSAGQGIAVSSPSDLVFSKAILAAGQGIAVSSSSNIEFSEATLSAGQGISVSSPIVMQGAGTAALKMVNSTVTAPNGQILISGGELVFTNTKLSAGQGIAVSSPKRIRFENSSQLATVTAVVMQGAGTAALEVVNSAIATPNGQILIDQFDRIQMESAILVASVIRARVVSRSGVLQISNSTLAAEELLRLYAEGSRGMVEFVGDVNLSGRKIDIAGKTVRVKRNGTVTTGPNTTVYASTRKYNKDRFGTISEHKQEKFNARPSFSGGRTRLQGRRD